MSVYQVMAHAILDVDEDRIEVIKDGQVMGMQARITYEQAVDMASGSVSDWKQFFGLFVGRDFRGEAIARVGRHHHGILDVRVHLMLDVDLIESVTARVRRLSNGTISYREVDVTRVMVQAG